VFQNLLISVPSFIGEATVSMITSCIQLVSSGKDSHASEVLIKIPEKITSRTLLPMMGKMWNSEYSHAEASRIILFTWSDMVNLWFIQSIPSPQITAFFDFYKQCLSSASRAEIMDNLKHLFKMFIDAFALSSDPHLEDSEDWASVRLSSENPW